jgi:hypothetical protein
MSKPAVVSEISNRSYAVLEKKLDSEITKNQKKCAQKDLQIKKLKQQLADGLKQQKGKNLERREAFGVLLSLAYF